MRGTWLTPSGGLEEEHPLKLASSPYFGVVMLYLSVRMTKSYD